METETIQGNRVIADFMNRKPKDEYCVSDGSGICYSPSNIGFDWPPQQKQECERFLKENQNNGRLLEYKVAKYEWFPFYERDWNELMPVVERIEALENSDSCFGYEISKGHCWIYKKEKGETFEISNIEIDSTIQAVWLAVIEFIKWYNKNKTNG